jgi:AcrR family transcriptional regulator
MTARATDHRKATAERNVAAILDAAERLLERRGPATIAAVAAEAEVSRVTVYAHFPTWEALIEAVVERAVQRSALVLDASDPGSGPAIDAFSRLLAAGWQDLARNSAIAEAAAARLSADAMVRSHQAAHARVADLIERGRRDGSFRTDLPAGWLVTATFALIHACADDVRAGRLQPAEAERVLPATLRGLLTGPGRQAAGRPPGRGPSG